MKFIAYLSLDNLNLFLRKMDEVPHLTIFIRIEIRKIMYQEKWRVIIYPGEKFFRILQLSFTEGALEEWGSFFSCIEEKTKEGVNYE